MVKTRLARGKIRGIALVGATASAIADSHTPLIRNVWYVAALTAELDAPLTDRWLLGQNVLLYRTESGGVVAMDNRCPHRSFPLSKGRRCGDNVACGYHGMTFNPAGQCVSFPPIKNTPGNIRTQTFPVVERAPLIWIWLGDPALADETFLPEHQSLAETGWAAVSGYYRVNANYVGLQENLQDLSHFEHLHSSSIGVPDQSISNVEITAQDGRIHSKRVYENVLAPPMWKNALGLQEDRITRTIDEAFRSPALCDALTTIRGRGAGDPEPRDYHIKIMHFITPEHQQTTHYWWFFARDFAVDDADADRLFEGSIGAAFQEDKDALEWIAALANNDEREKFQELSFGSDKTGVLLRRQLYKMAAQEAS